MAEPAPTRGDHIERQRRQQQFAERTRTLTELADEGHRALAVGDTDRAAAIAALAFLPQIESRPGRVWQYEDQAHEADGLDVDGALLRGAMHDERLDSGEWWRQLSSAEQRRLFRSAYAALVIDGRLDGDATTAVPVTEYEHQVGERYYSPTSGGREPISTIDADGDLKATLFTGEPGSGKTAARKTVTEDRLDRGHKVVDLLDMLKAENATYDVEAQASWQHSGRDEMGLDVGFGSYEPPTAEIRVPLTDELAEQRVPYDTDRDEFVVKPFVIPASDLTYRQLIMVLPHVTKTQENHLRAAHQYVRQQYDDYTLADIARVIREETNAGDTVADRIERSLETAQEKGFIQDESVPDEYILEWQSIMAEPETVTSFTNSTLREKSDRLLLASYLLDSLYQARRELLIKKQLYDYPTLTVAMGEIHEIAPRLKSEQDAESTIEAYMIDTLGELIALVRHADVELLCDTQKFHQQLSPEVSGLFHRIFAFGGHKPDIKKIFSTRIGSTEAREQAPKVTDYDDGRCALVSGDGFSMPIQFAPPRAHHLDAKRDGNGLGFRTRHLDHEELREAPWDASIPERMQFDDTPDSPVRAFWETQVIDTSDSDALVLKEAITDAYQEWAEIHEEDPKTHKKIHSYIGRHFDVEDSRTTRHDKGDKRKMCYKHVDLRFNP